MGKRRTVAVDLPAAQESGDEEGEGNPFLLDNGGSHDQESRGNVDAVHVLRREGVRHGSGARTERRALRGSREADDDQDGRIELAREGDEQNGRSEFGGGGEVKLVVAAAPTDGC